MPVTPKAKYEIVADDKTAAAWKSAVGRADDAGKRIASIAQVAFAGVAVSAIGGAISKAIEFGDEIGKAATKAGLGAKQMSELSYAAKMNDIDITSLSTAIKKMQVGLSEAASGSKTAKDALAALGLSIGDIKSLAPDQQFELLADRIASLKDPADRARAATQLFGKAGADLLPMFSKGAEGILAAREEAKQLGLSLDADMVAKLQDADDSLKKLSASWQGLSATLVSKFVPAITASADAVRRLMGGASEVEKIQQRLEFLKGERDSFIPAIFNFGYIEGGGMVMGKDALDKAISDYEAKLARMRRVMGNARGGGHAPNSDGNAAPGFGGEIATDADRTRKVTRGASPAYAEFEQYADYFKKLEDQVTANHEAAAKHRQEVSELSEAGIREAVSATKDANEQALDEYVKGLERAYDKTETMSVYAEEAARNMQDAFADFLFDPFEEGLDGMFKGFTDIIRKMLAEAMSAQLFDALFGKQGTGSSGSSSSGWLSAALQTFFGGYKAEGGPLTPGKWHIAGEFGPEPVWGGGPGAFAMGYQNMRGDGPITVVNNVSVNGASAVTKADLAQAMKQASDQTVARIRDEKKRGKPGL